jgi:uncharacterized protein YndB with AHSA1/START domain
MRCSRRWPIRAGGRWSNARVFKAFADPAAKRRWFIEGEGSDIESYESDFRVGGLETSRFRFKELKRSAAAA